MRKCWITARRRKSCTTSSAADFASCRRAALRCRPASPGRMPTPGCVCWQGLACGEGRNLLTALIVPAWDKLRTALGVNGEDAVLARDPAVSRFMEERIAAALKDVCSWEQIKKFALLPNPFTLAADELTVS